MRVISIDNFVLRRNRYCAAIEAGAKPLTKNSQAQSSLHPAFMASLEDLLERLTGAPSINPANVLGGGRKSSKPGFDKLGSWIEGRLTKFIAGEEGEKEAPKPTATSGKAEGPFAHFSSVSPDLSGSITRNSSMADVGSHSASNGFLGIQPMSRTTSPAAQSQYNSYGQRSQPSGASHNNSLDAHSLSRATSPSTQTHNNFYASQSRPSSSSGSSYGDSQGRRTDFGGGFTPWSANAGAVQEEDGEMTPHAYGAPVGDDQAEFISPMAGLSIGPSMSTTPDYTPRASQPAYGLGDDDEDLGFGNSSLSKGRTAKTDGEGEGKAEMSGGKAVKGGKEEPKKEEPTQPAKREYPFKFLT